MGKQWRFEKVKAAISFSMRMTVLPVGPFGDRDPPARIRTKRMPTHSIIVDFWGFELIN
jgi:hypothetical protein